MYEKILQKLMKQKKDSSNVSDRSLQDLARSLSTVVTTDDLLEKLDLSAAIASIDGNLRHNTTSALEKIEAARVLKEEEAAAALLATQEAERLKKEGQPDIAGAVAQAVKDAMAPVLQELSSFKTEKTTTGRKERLDTLLKDAPDYFKTPIISAFGNTKFEDDEKFEEYLTNVGTSQTDFFQVAKENNLPISIPDANVKKPIEDGQTQTLSDAASVVAKAQAERDKLKT